MHEKEMEKLQAEKERVERQLAQEQHKIRRLENRTAYYEKGERRKRAHRLITRGAAIESVAPQTKDLSETEFYTFAERVFALPDTQRLLMEVTAITQEVTEYRVISFSCDADQAQRGTVRRGCCRLSRREKLHSKYYGEDSDYTRKGGVICSEILLPSHAPPEYADRETLWNAVEKAERGKKAQLAYSFDIALQNEFSMKENIDLARQFLLQNFVSRGMVTDFAVHQPDKEDGGISNPHFHVMCPIRPIEPDGKWGKKQRREYVLDEHGECVLDEVGNYVFNAVHTTDLGKPETLEAWRQAWADLCNAKFTEKGLDCRIDHRSFARQGVEQIPTQHEGPTVRAMEAKGIRTNKGDLNRFIRKTNALLREAKEKIAALIGWLKDVKAELAKPQPPMLNDLLALHCANRNKGAYSNKAKNANLQRYAEAFSLLQSKKLYTVDDLDNALHAMQDKIDTLKKSASSKQARIKEVDELLRMVDYYKSGK